MSVWKAIHDVIVGLGRDQSLTARLVGQLEFDLDTPVEFDFDRDIPP